MFPVRRSSDTACARSSFIVEAMIFSISFGILSVPGAFPFRNLWITSSILSGVTVVEIWMVLVGSVLYRNACHVFQFQFQFVSVSH